MSMKKEKRDRDGYRANVAIVLMNHEQKFFWGKRSGQEIWQFPQGGVHASESLRQALYRELWEEVGLKPYHVREINRTKEWLYYDVPSHFTRRRDEHFVGQKQIWFHLEMRFPDDRIDLNKSAHPEFDDWRWDTWQLLPQIADFKQEVYQRALIELFPNFSSAVLHTSA